MGPANPPDLGWLPRSRTLLQAAGALLAVALVLGFLGFSHKPTVPAPAKTDYTQKVTFAYDAATEPVSYTHLRAHETPEHLVCRLLHKKKKICQRHILGRKHDVGEQRTIGSSNN